MKCVFLILLTICSFWANATNYYVSASGNDANDGTSPSTAWRTISKVNSRTFVAGDAILFRSGDMWREQLTLNSSGAAGSPIIYGAYGTGAKPIINGADLISGWANMGGSVWSVNNPNVTTTRAMVVVGGVICSEVSSRAAVNSPGKYFIDQAANPRKIYVYSTVDPASLATEVSKRDYCIVATDGRRIHHVNFVNLQAQYAGNGGLILYGTEGQQFQGNCVVDGCVFYGNRLHGCAAYDGHANDVFKNSTSTYNGNGFYAWMSDGLTIQNCSTAHNIYYSIAPNMSDGHAYGAYRANNWLVENCVSDDDNDAIHTDAGGVVASAIIRYNKVYNSRSGSPNTPGMGVGSLASGGLIQIYYNLIVNCSSNGFESYTKSNGQVRFYNNTVYLKAGTGTDGLIFLKYGDNFIFKNNLFIREYVANKYTVAVYNPSIATSDYNVYFNGGQPSRYYYNGASYNALSTWNAATGQDAHSLTVDPLINTDYSLKSGSPCIDKGVSVGLTRDILGNPIVGAPDIGAFEQVNAAPAPNQTPKVNAGSDQSIQLPKNSVTLNGTATDADGSIAKYLWTVISGAAGVNFSSPGTATTNVTGLQQGTYTFRLTVTDNIGATAFDDITVSVGAAPVSNVSPTVDAGTDQAIQVGGTLSLKGTAADADGSIAKYLWTVISGAAGVNFSSPGTATTNVTGLQQGSYTFRLTVTDNIGATAFDDIIISVAAAPVPNALPTVNAGTDQSIQVGGTLGLKGTAADADGSIAKYLWTVISGAAGANFSSPGTATTNVTGIQQGSYTFRLTVTDNTGATAFDDIIVSVAAAPVPNALPTVNAGTDQSIQVGGTLSLKGTAADADGSIAKYLWTVISGAAGANFSSPGTATTNVTGIQQGSYTFRLTVTDNTGATAFDDVQVSVSAAPAPPPPNASPTVNAGTDQTIQFGANLTLNGSAADADGSIIAYQWSVVAGAAGISFSSSATAATAVTGMQQGNYTFRLTVKDNKGATAYDDIKVTVGAAPVPPPNTLPTVNAGADQAIQLGANLGLYGNAADADGSISSYQWSVVAGAAGISFSSSATAVTSVTGMQQGSYTFRLTVKDNKGATAYDDINVAVSAAPIPPPPQNVLPSVNAGTDQAIQLGANLGLYGNAADADGSISSYQWSVVAGAAGISFSSSATAVTNVTGMQQGSYTFRLTVKDNKGATAYDDINVAVSAAPIPPPPQNVLPTVNAGTDQTIQLGANLGLYGKATDTDGSIIAYQWSVVAGAAGISFSSSATAVTNVTGLQQGNYTFRLTVKDNKGATAYDDINVTVGAAPAPPPNALPTVNAGTDQTIQLGANLGLYGKATDTDGSIIAYQWSVVAGAAGISFSSSATAVTNVTGLQQGSYTFRLTAKDNKGAIAYDDINVTVGAAPAPPPNALPTVNAGTDQAIQLGANLGLYGKATDTDGSIIAYQWSVVAGAAGISFSSSATAVTNVTGIQQGSYTFRLTVKDNKGATAYDDIVVKVSAVTVAAAPPANMAPIANAGPDINLIAPQSQVSLSGAASNDPDGNIVSWSWTQTGGAGGVSIASVNTASSLITGLTAGTYEFQLTVQDDDGAKATDLIKVIVTEINAQPVAIVTDTITITLPVQSVELDGGGSYDPDGNIAAFKWSFISGPSVPRLLSPAQSKSVVADLVAGVYDLKLTISDNKGARTEANVTVVVKNSSNKLELLRLNIYPNPAVSTVAVSITAESMGRTSVTLYDERGVVARVLEFMKTSSEFKQEINLSGLSQGTYFVVVKIDNKESVVRKLIKL